MASGTISKSYSGYTLKSEWSSQSDTAGNYSDVTVNHYLVGDQTIYLGTTTHRVGHNSDGTKTVNLSTTFNIKANIAGNYVSSITNNEDITLDTIPRAPSYNSTNVSSITETSVYLSSSVDTQGLSITGGGWDISTDGGNTWTYYDGGVTGRTISGLNADTQYWYRGYCVTAGGGSNSGWDTFRTYPYPYISSAPNFDIGNQMSIGIHNPLNRNCQVYIIANDNSTMGGDTTTGTSIGGYYNSSWQNFWYASIPNSSYGDYRVRLVVSSLGRDTTVSGGRYYAKEIECKPDVSAIFKDNNASSIAQTGNENIIVKGVSNMLVTVNGTPKHSASISSYSIVCDDGQRATNQVSTIIRPMSPIVRITVTDSRGFSNTATYNLSTLNQWLNYTILAYTSDIEVKRSEQLSDQVILNVSGNYFNDVIGKTAGFRNIQVGDDLSGKTIYCDFPNNTFFPIMKTGDYDIITATKKITQSYDSNTGEVFVKADTENLYYYDEYEIEHKVASYTLPNDFGVVTAIDSELDTYECIKILSDDTLVDNYNSLSMYFQYKQSGTNNWSNAIAITPTISGNRFYVNNQSLGSIFNHNNEYVFRVITYDKLMQIGDYIEEVVTKATPIIRIGDEFVQVNGNLLINDSVILAGYTLYSSNGETDTITLSDNVSNYEYLEIYYYDYDGSYYSIKTDIVGDVVMQTTAINLNNGGYYIKMNRYSINGNRLVYVESAEVSSVTDNRSFNANTTYTKIRIYKVIGYK